MTRKYQMPLISDPFKYNVRPVLPIWNFLPQQNICQCYPILERGCAVLLLLLCHALATPPLDSETGWTGELWSKTNLLKLQN